MYKTIKLYEKSVNKDDPAICKIQLKKGEKCIIISAKYRVHKGGADVFQHAKIESLDDFFLPLSKRRNGSIFFCRIDGYSDRVAKFIMKYFDEARHCGVIIDGRIPNPDPSNLSYYTEIMGSDFMLDRTFLDTRLKKWLPRMSDGQRKSVVEAMFSTLQDMMSRGKNENMLRNTYIKYMCWLYYKFERIVNQLGAERPPKILYDGTITHYELQLLIVLARAGADIVLLEKAGDEAYKLLDPASEYSFLYEEDGLGGFPEQFGMKWIQTELAKEMERERLYGSLPTIHNCTNAWLKKPDIKEALTGAQIRGTDPNYFCNMFAIQYGVEDKLLFPNDMFSFYRQMKGEKRKICVVNGNIPIPQPEEIAEINRKNYRTTEQLIVGLLPNIQYPANLELQGLMVKSFIDIVLEESNRPEMNLSRLTNKAVYLLVWLKRYQKELFSNWKMPEISAFILFGKCESENECLFLRMISKLPIDVLVFLPNLNFSSCLNDPDLLEIRYENSLPMDEFPIEQAQMRVSTVAYQAERELDAVMYQDSGMYRNQQYTKAEAVTLQPMYEEISILWDQELKYRPSFGVVDNTVTVPVLLEKVCGVKDGQVDQYWLDIKKLLTPDTVLVSSIPWISSQNPNPIKPYATQFLQNGKLQKEKIKKHKAYQYSILRPEMQDYLLECIQKLLDQRVIEGTYQNGTEYTIVSVALDLPKDILRMVQKFDFTKKNPKVIIINTTEKVMGLEDSILAAFLNLVGFDMLFFVPTGYRCIEQHFRPQYIHEQQIGEYIYDLATPNFDSLQENELSPFRKLFRRS